MKETLSTENMYRKSFKEFSASEGLRLDDSETVAAYGGYLMSLRNQICVIQLDAEGMEFSGVTINAESLKEK